MREIGAIAGYLVFWLFSKMVLGIQSGLVALLLSLLFAFAIYMLISYAEHEDRSKNDNDDV
jgi:high-affinity Fe2+/Pb2+ permease